MIRSMLLQQLQPGLYIVKLDISWWRSPFWRSRFMVNDHYDIELLRLSGVQRVEVDLSRSTTVVPEPVATAVVPVVKPSVEVIYEVLPEPEVFRPTPLSQRAQEYACAVEARALLEASVASTFARFHQDGTLQHADIHHTVQEAIITVRSLAAGALFMAMSQRKADTELLQHHALSTCALSIVFGQSLGLNAIELERLATAALLHDIGLFQLPTSAWRTADCDETTASRARYQTHPAVAAKILKRHPFFDDELLAIISTHHHPYGWSGSSSIVSRALGIIDRYDEYLMGLGGLPLSTSHQALQRIYQEGRQDLLDPTLSTQLIRMIGLYPVHSTVQLTTHEIGTVTDLNPDMLHEPVITVTHDAHGRPYHQPKIITLGNHSHHYSIARILPSVLAYSTPLATPQEDVLSLFAQPGLPRSLPAPETATP